MNTAIGSVVYSQGIEYIGDFLESLKKQSVQDFSIILLNDDIEGNIFEKNYSSYLTYFGSRIQVISTQKICPQPYELRVELLEIAKKLDIDLLVLCDCDDICAKTRIEENQKTYDENLFFLYNEFRSFEGERIMPTMPNITNTITQIQEHNYLGLSNTALIMNRMSSKFIRSLKNGKAPIFDWYLFSRIILEGGTGKKVKGAITYYRIYQHNLAGKPQNELKELEKELEVKKRHYELLKKYDSTFERLIRKYDNLDLNKYITSEKVPSFWWGQLKCKDT